MTSCRSPAPPFFAGSGSREAVLEDAFECFGGVHWFFIIVSVPFAFFYLLFSLRFFRAGSELDNIEFYLNIFNWSDDVDKVPRPLSLCFACTGSLCAAPPRSVCVVRRDKGQ